MEMQMTFYWGYDATILFPWWECSTATEFYLSCLCIFILCLGSSKLKSICHDIQQGQPQAAAPVIGTGCSGTSVPTATGGSNEINSSQSPMTTENDRWTGAPPLLQAGGLQSPYNLQSGSWTEVSINSQQSQTDRSQRWLRAKPFIRWFLMFVFVTIDWAMMLVCMTFNAGLFLAVVGGVATGQLLYQYTIQNGGNCCAGGIHG